MVVMRLNAQKNENLITEIALWVTKRRFLMTRQKIAIAAGIVLTFLSTSVCAPMGGEGAQSLFKTNSQWVYWSFFVSSPILILLLGGRPFLHFITTITAPKNRLSKKIFKPLPSLSRRLIKYLGLTLLGAIAGSFNAYCTMLYLPLSYAAVCAGPALIVPGFPMVSACIEYHRRIWSALRWVLNNKYWREKQRVLPEQQLKKTIRQYRQLTKKERYQLDTKFTHLYTSANTKLAALFNLSKLLNESPNNFDKPQFAFAVGILGFLIGIMAEFYSFQFGRKMVSPVVGTVLGTMFGIVVAYIRMGISAVATMDVSSNLVDDAYRYCKTRSNSLTVYQSIIRFGIFLLALTSSLPTVQNQIQTMGHEGFLGHVLSICAIIANGCVVYWAGDLVFRDYQSTTLFGSSYIDCHARLFNHASSLKEKYRSALTRAMPGFANLLF